eukprot:gnl/Carplike_NY0171/12762_a18493_121.p2 GENE.gnl/Carplike_NY0171/12762_a18493_121~~gnl/Carplike_NY0171/12762_a18493_121.p2  ORF type:complete len:117 (-),score=8.31 gnl/Carplike_NY0171/12762_a18493_121:522-872(-)
MAMNSIMLIVSVVFTILFFMTLFIGIAGIMILIIIHHGILHIGRYPGVGDGEDGTLHITVGIGAIHIIPATGIVHMLITEEDMLIIMVMAVIMEITEIQIITDMGGELRIHRFRGV